MLPLLRRLLSWSSIGFISAATAVSAADFGEYQVKAGFLFNFAKFTEWPAEAWSSRDTTLNLCITGKDPFGGAVLAAFESRLVGNREFHSRRGVGVDELSGCHVLFIASSEERNVQAILRAAGTRPILTISDIEGFVEAGGMIGLVTLDERIQFDVNLAACQRAALKPSSKMLKLAHQVYSVKGR